MNSHDMERRRIVLAQRAKEKKPEQKDEPKPKKGEYLNREATTSEER